MLRHLHFDAQALKHSHKHSTCHWQVARGQVTGRSCPKHCYCVFATTSLGLIKDLISPNRFFFVSTKVL